MKGATLLWADDNPGDRELIQRSFRRSTSDVTLVMARDGQEVMDLLNGSGLKAGLEPNLVVLDLEMPRMSGWQLLTVLRADPRFKDMPMVVFSGSGMASDIAKANQCGASDYVQKPLEPHRFREGVLDLVQRWIQKPSSGGIRAR